MAEPHAATWCVHFTGIMDKTCKAGIRYEDVRDTSVRPYRLPCILKEHAASTCPQLTRPTQEEIAESERQTEMALAEYLAKDARKPKTKRFDVCECQLCADKPQMGPFKFERHIREVHGVDPNKVVSKFSAHGDGTSYFDNDYDLLHDDKLIAYHWTRQLRDKRSRALWEAQ